MWLENISLLNFKNYEELTLSFSKQINCLVGENGSGKTNLLDAIYYLSLTKSAFSSTEAQNIRHEAPFFMLKGLFHKQDEKYNVQFSLQNGQKKQYKNSRIPYEKLSEHIGLFPVVLITPDDTDIIKGGSEIRRKFYDGIISQINGDYLDHLLRYNHTLKQRNSLLKQFAEQNYYDNDLLDSYSDQLLDSGERIHNYRKKFINQFFPTFIKHYNNLSGQKEEVEITYQSDFENPQFKKQFYKNYRRDLLAQRTTQGIHKDDFLFEINGFPVKKYGSQGQQKSFVISLKLSQFDIIKEEVKTKPILLLDDVFDKLDDFRIGKLSEMVAAQSFGQLFVTDARPERTYQIFDPIKADKKVFTIYQGQVTQVDSM
ncbi:DNA replication and repair protein RecF [Catalinimonas alkaloidigena]|uniref:DNA replication/repair protein RecF n=1 Tax=Catalinimonas alkaloidigena TaxID=1075417 RepID=UPI002405CD02|nr:DNA replication/repair protein RecF [Catalinimonas alkaloidigena]MDF9799861.1 DNA replication and repair protein RecF [Catalinimonas alkaloidigena]